MLRANAFLEFDDTGGRHWRMDLLGLSATGLFHAALDFQEYYFSHAHPDLTDTLIPQHHRYLLATLGRFDNPS